MRVLAVHAFYQQFGGEDRMFAADTELVESRGHEVHRFTFDNVEVDSWSRLRQARNVVWNREQVRRVRQAVADFRPHVAHVQNFFPSLSPAVLRELSNLGVPVVLRLPNYRLLCVNGTLFRDGAPCTKCVGKSVAWPGIRHGCYRESAVASAGVAAMVSVHRFLGTWTDHVDAYLALSEEGRDLFVRGGLPPGKVVVRPNYLVDFPSRGSGSGGHVIYSGRLTREKGIATLLEAWRQLDMPVPLVIAGSGPLEEDVKAAAAGDARIRYAGWTEKEELQRLVGEAACAVVPSEWAEPFGLVALEATAAGTPAIVTDMGGLKTVVREGISGRVVPPSDPAALAAAVREMLSNPESLAALRESARLDAMTRFSAEAAYDATIDLYKAVRRPERVPGRAPDRLPSRLDESRPDEHRRRRPARL